MKFVKSALLIAGMLLFASGAVFAQVPNPKADAPAEATYKIESVADQARLSAAMQPKSAFADSRALGVGLIIMGAGLGIGGLTKTAMIIAAALIEGVTFFALIIVMLFVTPY